MTRTEALDTAVRPSTGPALPHELVLDRAARTPDAQAIVAAGQAVSYAELVAGARRLAAHLVDRGVGPDVPVGLCAERSPRLVMGMLAALLAGGAYAPLDPAYPVARLRLMLEDLRPRVVLSERRHAGLLPWGDADVVILDEDPPESPASLPSRSAARDDLAYVLFTSGSTGRPKGVAMPHGPLANLLAWQLESWTPPAAARTLQFASPNFDVSFQEIFATLAAGGTLVMIDEATRRDPGALVAVLAEQQVERLFLPFVALAAVADAVQGTGTVPRALREVISAGEALRLTPAIAELFSALDGCVLHNQYGPTESHVVTQHSLTGSPAAWPLRPPIGRPIPGAQIHLLDPGGAPVPEGEQGELHIAGPVLARGYLGRPELTAERFLPDPFSDSAAARMYRTGDEARRLPDGAIQYLGRLDDQVKISGYRVEIGEVEARLSSHPAVSAAAAAAHSDRDGPAELAGYVVFRGGPVPTGELRRFVAEALPPYMVPSTVTALDALPVTPSGKLDRRALPAPTRERPADRPYVAARTPLEQQLVAIWERVLEMQPVGVTDNLFDLGVTSLAAARLIAQVEHEIRGQLPLGALFQAPTVEALAHLMEEGGDGHRWTSLVPIQPKGTRPPIYCVHGGAGTVLHLEPLARALGEDQPFYGLQARGLYGRAAPLKTVEEMAAHYLSEVRTLQPEGPYYLSGYCFGTVVAFDMAMQLVDAGEEVALLAMLTGPSATWTRQWRWHGNQPSIRHRYEYMFAQAQAQPQTRRARLAGALRHPSRLPRPAVRAARKAALRLALVTGRPVPEEARDAFFLQLHSRAERSYYERGVYPGDMLVICGEGMYEDPDAGWGSFVAGEIESHVVPGHHTRNRQLMMEPYVLEVRDHIQQYLVRESEIAH